MDENIGLFITEDVYSIITHNYVSLVKPKFGKKVYLVGKSWYGLFTKPWNIKTTRDSLKLEMDCILSRQKES